MPSATITSTASTFGTISGTFVDSDNVISGTISGVITGTLDGSVGVPGVGVPDGGTAGQVLAKVDGVDYNTEWVTPTGGAWGTITGTLSAQTDLQTALNLKAPLASPALTGVPTAPTAATLTSTTQLATTAFVQQELAAGTAVAKNLEVYVRNQSGSTIPAGSIVYISGATGNRPLITLAQANNDANSAQTIGFVKTSIANNGFGFVIVRGELENIDTSALAEGVQLYLSPTTAGTWTTTKPSAPQHLVYVGIVIRSHPTQGVILVAVQNGYELNELHDVAIASVANNDLLAYEASTDLWKNKSFSTLGLATQSWVTAGFYPLASNPAGYLTSSALTPYLLKAGGIITGDIQSNNGSGYRSYDGLYKQTNVSASMIQLSDANIGGSTLSIESSGITFPSGKQTVHYPGTSILSGYATESWVTAGFYPLTGNPSGFITSSALTGYATQAWVDAQGYLQAGALTGYALESWVTSQGYLTDAPSDGNQYARKNGAWDVVSAGSSYITSVTSPLAVTGSDLSIDLTGYATESWVTGQNYLTDAAAAATYETIANAAATYYPLSGNPSGFLVSSDLAPYLTSATAASTYQTISGMSSYAPLASPALTGNVTITTNSTSPALFITQTGTGNIFTLHDQASDTTFVAIDQNGKVGTIASTTTAAGLNVPHGTAPTTPVNGDIWTTTSGLFMRQNGSTKQYVDLDGTQTINGQKTFSASFLTLGNSTAAGTINIGTGATISGSTKSVLIGTSGVAGSTTNITIGSTTGTSTTTLQGSTVGTTLAADTNTTGLATTAFVVGQAGSATPLINGTAAVGTSLRYARQDHVHPTDTSRAPLASPALTGVPTAPTAANGTNTTQIATTAFVLANGGSTSFATTAQVVAGTSTTTALAPANVGFLVANPRLQSLAFINSASASGSGASTTSTPQTFSRQIYLGSLATGRSAFSFGAIGSTNAGFGTSTAKADQVDFSKKVWIAGYACMGWTGGTSYIGDANTMCRITLGGYSTNTTGDMTLKGIGLKKVGGSSSFVNLTVHNGTTLTDVASTVTVPDGGGIHWQIYSDGTGNVTLYINGTQAATTTAGPTTATASGQACYREQVEAVATPGVRQAMNCNGGWFYTE